jgi:hypothetical protein
LKVLKPGPGIKGLTAHGDHAPEYEKNWIQRNGAR